MTIEVKEKPLYRKGKPAKKCRSNFYGFDVETDTAKDNQEVILFALVGCGKCIQSKDINDFKEEIKKKEYRGCWIGAHNLMFDFHATFKNSEMGEWNRIYAKGGTLLSAYSYVVNGKFVKNPESKLKKHKITFIDTLNFAQMKLEKIGEMIGEKKMSWDFSKNEIKTDDDYKKFREYNIQDAKIAVKFLEFLAQSFFKYGTNIKMTIASTSEKIFRNNYLDDIYEQQSIEQMDFIYRGYYGGRVEVFRRGYRAHKTNVHDVNSMYPWAMRDFVYPNPNTANDIKEGDIDKLMQYEGFAEVHIRVPYMYRGPLPYRTKDGKVLFPYGELNGVWSHNELRNALKFGCTIIKISRMIYYTETCRPFEKFVNFFYSERIRFENEGNKPMAYICKILLNSLYGKFAQRYGKYESYVLASEVDCLEELGSDYELMKDNYTFKVSSIRKPSIFCFPCWSAYVTAYGRIRILDEMNSQNASAGDTDSTITEDEIICGNNLGDMKLEYSSNEVMLIRPKMYAINHSLKKPQVKCKGLSKPLNFSEFHDAILLSVGSMNMKIKKFIKYKESLRRNMNVNSVLHFEKAFSLEDNKRVWKKSFNPNEWQDSMPHMIIDGITETEYKDLHKNDKKQTIFFKGDDET